MKRSLWFWVLLLGSIAWGQAIPDTFKGVERIVALGDVHADYERFAGVLRQAGLVDANNVWSGGKTHLVLCGDLIDRGSNSARVLDLVMALEPQAIQAGGRVHALLGNHEAMNLAGDLRYVPVEDYAAYRQPNSEQTRATQMQRSLAALKRDGASPPDQAAWEKQYIAEHPLGWVERALAFLPDGKYGKWLIRHNAVIRINDTLFLHGGISAQYVKRSLKSMNEDVRAGLSKPDRAPGGIIQDDAGPLWYRGLMLDDENNETTTRMVGRVLEEFDVRRIVLGHTPNPAIMPRFDGRVLGIDVGLARAMGGPSAYLLIDKGVYYAVHQGRQLPLPVKGGSVLEYLRSAAALDSPGSRLRVLIDNRDGPNR
jgi:predicted MPP superfamily phosphohydrolase